MRILVVCDDRWHPAAVARQGLASFAESGFELDWVEDAGEWSAERMGTYPAVIFAKANHVSAADTTPWMTEKIEAAFVDYVRNGKGLLVVHAGTAGYQDAAMLRGLMGGVFDRHPAQCEVTITPLEGHPLAAGSVPFTMRDEHYFMLVDDPGVDHFVTTSSEHGVQSGGWRRTEGNGRVCVLTPGHNVDVWLHPSYQTLLRNGLRWCLGE